MEMKRYVVTVDYSIKMLEYALHSAQYNIGSINDRIVGQTPVNRSGKKVLMMITAHFAAGNAVSDAIAELILLDIRPAETAELIALGVQHPESAKDFVMAPGTVYMEGGGHNAFAHLQPSSSGVAIGLRGMYPHHSHLVDFDTGKYKCDFWVAGVESEQDAS